MSEEKVTQSPEHHEQTSVIKRFIAGSAVISAIIIFIGIGYWQATRDAAREQLDSTILNRLTSIDQRIGVQDTSVAVALRRQRSVDSLQDENINDLNSTVASTRNYASYDRWSRRATTYIQSKYGPAATKEVW